VYYCIVENFDFASVGKKLIMNSELDIRDNFILVAMGNHDNVPAQQSV
jgi:hypothetical protein